MMDALIRSIEDRLFGAEDTVCLERARLVTEAHRRHAGEPSPLRRALALRHLLQHMTLDLDSNPVFAGNTSSAPRAWMLVPEFGVGVEPQIGLETGMTGFLDGKVPADLLAFWKDRAVGHTPGGSAGIGHLSLDFAWVVQHGLGEALQRLDRVEGQGDSGQRLYRQAMRIAVEAVIAWAERCSDEAERLAATCPDPLRQRCLLRVASACRRVPRHPATTLFEGLQSIVLVHLASVLEGQGTSISIGLPDRALARFAGEAEADAAAAVHHVRAFLLKISANSFQGRGSKTQAITVGGALADGTDASNAVTSAFLEAFAATPVADPHLFLRWHPKLAPARWRRACELLATGRSMPMIVNDAQVAPGLLEAGVAEEDAWDYAMMGCNELGIPGRCCQSGVSLEMGFNDLDLVDKTLRESSGSLRSMEDVLDGYAVRLATAVDAGFDRRVARTSDLAEKAPFPFCSACCRNAVEAGADLLLSMPYAYPLGLFVRGTSNAVNALAAVHTLVFSDAVCTFAELLRGIDSRDEALLARIAAAPKWGNDDEHADRWGVALNRTRDRVLRDIAACRGIPPFALCHVVRSLHHLDGKRLGATADGRAAGEPVGDSIGAVAGTARCGPTALLNSVLKLDAAGQFPGIYNLNLTLSRDQAGTEVVMALAEAFLVRGGQELQVNMLDAERLREAQRHPEKHRDLIVRIAGLNARFVELAELEQSELIRRADLSETAE